MARLNSVELPLGTIAPDFCLGSVDDTIYRLRDFSGRRALLVAFICNHCPYVRAIEDRLITLARYIEAQDCAMVGICSNDATNYPADSKESLRQRWLDKNYGFPYLVDMDQSVAKAYGAVCTPDLFLFDRELRLYYHGQLDDNWHDETKVLHHDLKDALDNMLAGSPAPLGQKPSMGCSIKWKI
jgi:peroxiredoxin